MKNIAYLVHDIEELDFLIKLKNLEFGYILDHDLKKFLKQNIKIVIYFGDSGKYSGYNKEYTHYNSKLKWYEDCELLDTKTEIRKYKLKLLENLWMKEKI